MRVIHTADMTIQRASPPQMKHYEWIYGPNYGMIDCKLSEEGERPHVTRECFSLPLMFPFPLFSS